MVIQSPNGNPLLRYYTMFARRDNRLTMGLSFPVTLSIIFYSIEMKRSEAFSTIP